MPSDFIQIYPADAALRIEERERLYADILENVELGEFKKKAFGPALKRLCFEGRIESRDERIRDPGELISRINPLGTYVHAYLCLASPVVSEAAFVAILQHYKQASVTDMAIELVRYFDGPRHHQPGPNLHARVRCLVRALPQVISATAFQHLCGRMFSKFLSLACYRGTTENALVVDCWEGVEQFVGLGEDMESIHNLATDLFSGQAQEPRGYQDRRVIEFCQRYFQREWGPNLLTLLDTIYHAIPQDQRLRVERGAIVFTHPLAESAADTNETAVAAPMPFAQPGAGPVGTGFFCLVRSPTAAHSRGVESFLGLEPQAGAAIALDVAIDGLQALAPFAQPETLQRVDDTTVLLAWEADFAPEAGRAEAAACVAVGCRVLAPVLWLESGEVLHLHGLGPGDPWRFSRALGSGDADEDGAEVRDVSELLALLLAQVGQEVFAKKN